MARKTASRKYQLTINNPQLHGYDHQRIVDTLRDWSGIEYWCLCDEVGAEGTPHVHVYAVFANAVMFTTMQKRFYGAHIEAANGSNRENRDYIRKEGKWAEDEKHGTNLIDTFEESGDLPLDRVEGRKQSDEIYAMIKSGASNADILEVFPSAMTRLNHIEQTRQTLLTERYKNEFRQLEVTYIHGETGSGKTRGVMEKYGYENVYRVTDYLHPFDGYKGQDVVLFDEFRSSRPIGEMLDWLDGYPCELPCRFANKTACFTTVYIISNIPLEAQYPQMQIEQPKTWAAFRRRIHNEHEQLAKDANWLPD